MHSPIVIISLPRSGSSLTAGIFSEHGVWTGKCKKACQRNPKGFFENIRICSEIDKRFRGYVHKGSPCPKVEDWGDVVAQCLESDGYTGGKWLIKHSAVYAPLWGDMNPIYVNVWRDKESIQKSGKAAKIYNMNDGSYENHLKIMRDYGHVDVYPAEFQDGDFSSIIYALEYCGIKPDLEKIKEFYEPDYWHYKGI